MKTKRILAAAAAVGVTAAALVAGSLSGAFLAAAVDAPPPPPLTQADLSVHPVEKFPKNESGQTYGYIDQGLLSNASVRAQLIAVATDEGKDGWAYFAELDPVAVELLANDEERATALSTDEPYSVPVYDLDGKTVIGFHTVNRSPES